MLPIFSVLIFLLIVGCVRPEGVGRGDDGAIALTNVTVIDVAAADPAAARLPNQTVLVERGMFTHLGNARGTRIPRGTQVIDGRGRFLVPGLWDSRSS